MSTTRVVITPSVKLSSGPVRQEKKGSRWVHGSCRGSWTDNASTHIRAHGLPAPARLIYAELGGRMLGQFRRPLSCQRTLTGYHN